EGFFVYPAVNLAAFAGERRADGTNVPNYGSMTVATDREFTDMVALGRYIQENYKDPSKVRLINYDRDNEYRSSDVRREIGGLIADLGQTRADMERTVGGFLEQMRSGTLISQPGEAPFAQAAREEDRQRATKPAPETAQVQAPREEERAPTAPPTPTVGALGTREQPTQAYQPRRDTGPVGGEIIGGRVGRRAEAPPAETLTAIPMSVSMTFETSSGTTISADYVINAASQAEVDRVSNEAARVNASSDPRIRSDFVNTYYDKISGVVVNGRRSSVEALLAYLEQ
ncbi:hypothetical protein H0O01_03730, partial [Candidatus Micrarchaeota archaeon]|nr:hypothetical protein [Candidatus Micrarchaeota archaeon]